MRIAGKVGFFRLSPVGEQVLKEEPLRRPAFEALVVDEGEKGIVVRLQEEIEPSDQPGGLVLFLKWEYIASVWIIWKV
jgi:hypothetical protein